MAFSNQYLTNCRISSSSGHFPNRILQNPAKSSIAPDPGDNGGVFKRLLHKRVVFRSPSSQPMQIGESLVEKLRELDVARDRIRLDALAPPPPAAAEERAREEPGLTVADARKLMRVAQLEMVKSRLREVRKTWISYPEFVRICGEGSSDPEEGARVAKTLDESGTVIVFGNVVVLKPEQEYETLLFRQI
ncbi:hypothetical protein Tsubulata_035467 [Turnera subulata]|uniref:Calcium uniporter protein n=1 Tax=Turnera subulata TaxID=218843 RepID=A0A9Q0G7W2_9ROSI|nr:hypothetical protein Tsubulata_035467 [Turnera subulata]